MSRVYKPFCDGYVEALTQSLDIPPTTGHCPVTLSDEPTEVILNLTEDDFTRLFSAVLNGADALYPETAHQVTWLLWQAVEYGGDMPIVGEIRPFLLQFPPEGWLEFGESYPTVDYPELANALPAALISGNNIVLPDMTGTVLAGRPDGNINTFFEPALGQVEQLILTKPPATGTGSLLLSFGVNWFVYAG